MFVSAFFASERGLKNFSLTALTVQRKKGEEWQMNEMLSARKRGIFWGLLSLMIVYCSTTSAKTLGEEEYFGLICPTRKCREPVQGNIKTQISPRSSVNPGEVVHIDVLPDRGASTPSVLLVGPGVLEIADHPPYSFEVTIPKEQYPGLIHLKVFVKDQDNLIEDEVVLRVLGDTTAQPLRDPNPYEQFYFNVAVANREPVLCGKIAPNVGEGSIFSSEGRQATLLRSECYYYIAISIPDPALCGHVKPVSSLGLHGGALNPQACLEEIKKTSQPRWWGDYVRGGIDITELKKILFSLGYTEQDTPPDTRADKTTDDGGYRYLELFNQELRKPSFVSKVKTLPSFSK